MMRNKKRQAETPTAADPETEAADIAPESDSVESTEAVGAESDFDEVTNRIMTLESERDDAIGNYKRALADYHNYQKRSLQNERAASEYARQDVVRDLIPVLDNLDLALEHGTADGEESASPAAEQILHGVKMVHETLLQVLGNRGLRRLTALAGDEFDPTCQEAVMMQPSGEVAPQHVLQMVQVGYRMNETVLRPTKVVVAQALPSNESDNAETADATEES